MDLSGDENVRKRELRQVVDAFEYYVMWGSNIKYKYWWRLLLFVDGGKCTVLWPL
jgi:hypothetical protein